MKKLIGILLCLAMLFGMAGTAFAQEGYSVTGEFHYSPSLGFLGSGDPSRIFCYSDDYFSHSGYLYDHELCMMTMDLAGSADRSLEGDWSQSNKNFIDLMQQCGFENIAANSYITNGSTPDSIGVNMASRQLDDSTLLAVGLRGHSYGSEWASNLTVGRAGEHQGFGEARELALDYIREYIAAYGITGRIKLWVTGYSRSAIVANLVGGALDQGVYLGENVSFEPADLYCYTFEAPQGTDDPCCRDALYWNVHNVVNPNDLVTCVSLSRWGHSRYGIDYYLPCRQYNGGFYYSLKPTVDEILRNTECMSLGCLTFDLIDDFHYLSFDPVKTLKKQGITQIEFYDEFLNAFADVFAPTRDYYVDNLQNDFREFGASVMGITNEIPTVLKLFAEKFVSPGKLVQLYTSLVLGNKRAYEHAIKLVEEIFLEAMGEVGTVSYSVDQANAMIHNMAVHFYKLFKTAPDTVLTLLGNILQILNAHCPEIGRVWLAVTPAEFFEAQSMNAYFEEHVHDIDPEKFHPGQPATCCEEGTAAYYECVDPFCTAMLDENAEEIEDVVLPIDLEAHSFAEEWSWDETGHWHASTCGHEVRAGEGGHTDENTDHLCDVCGYAMSVCADEDRDGLCDYCGEATYSVELERVQYSLVGGWEWFTGTSCTIPDFNHPFKVRILDSAGTWTTFSVDPSGNAAPY